MTLDPRWLNIAREWLEDADVSAQSITRYAPQLAQQLQDVAEQFVASELPELEQHALDAAQERP